MAKLPTTKGGQLLQMMAKRAGTQKPAADYTTPRYEDEAGGSFKGQNSQKIVRPSVASMQRRPAKRHAGTARQILRMANRK